MTAQRLVNRGAASKVVLEALVVAIVGIALAFLANALSPRGLKLTRDFYHLSAARQVAPAPTSETAGATNGSSMDLLEAKLGALGLRLAGSNQVVELFNDPRRLQDLVVFIDARDPDHYRQGHIPGAYEFDNYHPDQFLGTIWPVCQAATQIVVYCVGGECDESRFAAQTLAELPGVPKPKFLIYGGGITEWTSNGLAVETGERNSGRMLGEKP